MLQEVVVTAQKRTERPQDVPVAVTSVSAESLKAVRANKVELGDSGNAPHAAGFDPPSFAVVAGACGRGGCNGTTFPLNPADTRRSPRTSRVCQVLRWLKTRTSAR